MGRKGSDYELVLIGFDNCVGRAYAVIKDTAGYNFV